MAELGPLTEEIVVARCIVTGDIERSLRSYTECSVAG